MIHRIPVVLLLVLASAIAACGSDDRRSRAGSPEAEALLDRTFAKTGKVRSGYAKFSLRVELYKDDFTPTVSFYAAGPFERVSGGRALPRFRFDLKWTAFTELIGAEGVADFGLTSAGRKLFVKLRGKDYAVAGRAYRQVERDFLAQRATRAKLRPRTWIARPRIVPLDARRAKTTISIHADVDWANVVNAFNAALESVRSMPLMAGERPPEPLDAKEIADKLETAEISVHVDKASEVLSAFSLRADLKGIDGFDAVHVDMWMTLGSVDEDQDIAAPAKPKSPVELVHELDEIGLGELGSLVLTGR
jgi:hypothetical protein